MTDERFTGIVNSGSLTDQEIADAVSVSIPTVRRWKAGLNLPAYSMRPGIAAALTLAWWNKSNTKGSDVAEAESNSTSE